MSPTVRKILAICISLTLSFVALNITPKIQNKESYLGSIKKAVLDIIPRHYKLPASTIEYPFEVYAKDEQKIEIVVKNNKEKASLISKTSNTYREPIVQTINTLNPEKELTNAVVNIICIIEENKKSYYTIGSGVVIDQKGIVLTNAHIAQYALLPKSDCVVRTGSPAQKSYGISLLYISQNWVKENYKIIRDEHPSGTGEDDFAFFAITDPSYTLLKEKYTLPTINTRTPYPDDQVLLLAYPASFLGSQIISRNLYLATALSTVKQLFTFKEDTVDLFSLSGTIVAQKGSSGGAVVDLAGTLVGIIVTSTEESTTAERELRAISIEHIDRNLKKETSLSIQELLNSNIREKIIDFYKNIAPKLIELLTK